MRSSSGVLPWSTCPMTVTTGGRGRWSAASSSSSSSKSRARSRPLVPRPGRRGARRRRSRPRRARSCRRSATGSPSPFRPGGARSTMSPALRFSSGPSSATSSPRSMMISPSGTGAVEVGRSSAVSARALRGCADSGATGVAVAVGQPGRRLGLPAVGRLSVRRTRAATEAAARGTAAEAASPAAACAAGTATRGTAAGPTAAGAATGRDEEGAAVSGRLPPMPGGGGMGRPLGPIGGRAPGGGGRACPRG